MVPQCHSESKYFFEMASPVELLVVADITGDAFSFFGIVKSLITINFWSGNDRNFCIE